MSAPSVVVLQTLGDNLTYLIRSDNRALVIDPSDATSVLSYLSEHSLQLDMILNTHHHFDHVGGNHQLKMKTGCTVYGTERQQTPDVDTVVIDGDVLSFEHYSFDVLSTPGHTPDSVSYYCTQIANDIKMIFTGDTLFCGGCGRIMGCEPVVMWQSLNRLLLFADDSLVYPGHDYTRENYQFAATVDEPAFVKDYLVQLLSRQCTIPTTIREEKEHNIFLRSKNEDIKNVLGMHAASDAHVFAKLRYMKDSF